jgi:hypothetical protein
MANREGKALSFVRVPSNYAAGIQEGDPTPVYIFPDDGSGIPLIDPATAGDLVVQTADGELVGAGTGIVLEQDPNQPTAARNALATGAAPNTLGVGAVDLQSVRQESTNVASGDVSFAVGYRSTASGLTAVAIGDGVVASGQSSQAYGVSSLASGDFSEASGVRAQAIHSGARVNSDSFLQNFPSIIADEYAVRARGGVRLVTATDGAGVPTKTTTLTPAGLWTYTDAASRNAQLTELFASIPTVAGAVGTLWNDGGTIKIVV